MATRSGGRQLEGGYTLHHSSATLRPIRSERSGRSPQLLAGAWATSLVLAVAGCSTAVDLGPSVEPAMGPHYTTVTDPFRGRGLYVSDDLQAAQWARRNHATSWLTPIIDEPQARWVNGPSDLTSLHRASVRAAELRRLLVAVAYSIPDRGCDDYREGSVDKSAYESFIDGMITALGPRPAVIILEPDAVAADCWTEDRAASLTMATERLTAAGHHVYLDAGHDGWRTPALMAQRLVQAGITTAAGFAVNVSARDTVTRARAYAEVLSDLVGSRPYVVDTSRNGLGPAADDGEHSGWCNPDEQALGVRPNTAVVGHEIAELWIKDPGESDGNGAACGNETAYAGLFSPRQARTLIAGARWLLPAQRRALPDLGTLPWTK